MEASPLTVTPTGIESNIEPISQVEHFQDFLKKHFPAIDSFPNEKRTLYQVRSQLAHGMDLLQADLEPWNFFIDAKMQNQDPLQRNLHFIAGIAIYNWLHSQ